MRRLIRYIVSRTYKPLLVKYLSGTRTYTHKNIVLEIPPAVFHPRFFFSTKLLLKYLDGLPLAHRSFLELGAGSGLISVHAARKGARVLAIDINPVAVAALKRNEALNKVKLDIIQSDLFDQVPVQAFDVIAINPPYYKKNPGTPADYAWYCGEGGEYFHQLFKTLGTYSHNQSEVLMILSEVCDIKMVEAIALQNGFRLNCVFTKKNLLEKNFIFKIELVIEAGDTKRLIAEVKC
jgi:release factor glutamine methyltransferase